MAMDDCVLAVYPGVSARTAWQFRQLQFHWGKPPPAAEPKTLIFMVTLFRGEKNPDNPKGVRGWQAVESTVGDVHGDFETETHVNKRWCSPLHEISSCASEKTPAKLASENFATPNSTKKQTSSSKSIVH
jgi:hypothetical protein